MHNVLFMGRKPVAATALEWLIENPQIHVVGVITDSHLSLSPTTHVAKKNNIPILNRKIVEKTINSGELKVDLALSLLYWQKIRKPLIENSSKGVINFHPAPLPEYKGTAGYNLAVLEGLEEWAVTAHYVDEKIDTGEIIDIEYFSISPKTETAKSLEKKSQPKLLDQFKRVVTSALAQEKLLESSPNTGGRYISRSEMEAMKEITEGDNIQKKIRAFWFPPYDGAYIVINNKKYTLIDEFILRELADPNTSNLFTKTTK